MSHTSDEDVACGDEYHDRDGCRDHRAESHEIASSEYVSLMTAVPDGLFTVIRSEARLLLPASLVI